MAVGWRRDDDGGHSGPMSPATHGELLGGEPTPRCAVSRNGEGWTAFAEGVDVGGTHATAHEAMAAVERLDAARVARERPGVIRGLGLDPVDWRLHGVGDETVLIHARHPGVELTCLRGLWTLAVDGACAGPFDTDPCVLATAYDASPEGARARLAANVRDIRGYDLARARVACAPGTDVFLDVRDRLLVIDRAGWRARCVVATEGGFATGIETLADLLRRPGLTPDDGTPAFTSVDDAVGHVAGIRPGVPFESPRAGALPPLAERLAGLVDGTALPGSHASESLRAEMAEAVGDLGDAWDIAGRVRRSDDGRYEVGYEHPDAVHGPDASVHIEFRPGRPGFVADWDGNRIEVDGRSDVDAFVTMIRVTLEAIQVARANDHPGGFGR